MDEGAFGRGCSVRGRGRSTTLEVCKDIDSFEVNDYQFITLVFFFVELGWVTGMWSARLMVDGLLSLLVLVGLDPLRRPRN